MQTFGTITISKLYSRTSLFVSIVLYIVIYESIGQQRRRHTVFPARLRNMNIINVNVKMFNDNLY